jgi:hypothetical protein
MMRIWWSYPAGEGILRDGEFAELFLGFLADDSALVMNCRNSTSLRSPQRWTPWPRQMTRGRLAVLGTRIKYPRKWYKHNQALCS